jgi:enamine deaminase RidA (YjgF/YER057c/UK114 family)
MSHVINDIGIASQIGAYSDVIEIRPNLRWLLASSTLRLSPTGDLPNEISGQAELAWKHVVHMLRHASMTVADTVKVTQYLTRLEDIRVYAEVSRTFFRRQSASFNAAGYSPAGLAEDFGRSRAPRLSEEGSSLQIW